LACTRSCSSLIRTDGRCCALPIRLGESLVKLGGTARSNFATSGEISAKLDCQFRAFTALWLMKVGVSSIGRIRCIHFCRWTSPHVRSSDSESACGRIVLNHISLPITLAKDIVRNCARAGSRRSGRKNGGLKMAVGGARSTRSQILESGNKPAPIIGFSVPDCENTSRCDSSRKGVGVPDSDRAKRSAEFAEKNFRPGKYFFSLAVFFP
jgi:hypothetical protein